MSSNENNFSTVCFSSLLWQFHDVCRNQYHWTIIWPWRAASAICVGLIKHHNHCMASENLVKLNFHTPSVCVKDENSCRGSLQRHARIARQFLLFYICTGLRVTPWTKSLSTSSFSTSSIAKTFSTKLQLDQRTKNTMRSVGFRTRVRRVWMW